MKIFSFFHAKIEITNYHFDSAWKLTNEDQQKFGKRKVLQKEVA